MNRDALLTAVRGPSLVDRIGDTPLVSVTGLEHVPDGVDVLGKGTGVTRADGRSVP